MIDRVEVIQAFEEGDPDEPYRRIATTAEHAYVSDPATGTVVEVALDGLEVERTFDVGVTPGYLGIAAG